MRALKLVALEPNHDPIPAGQDVSLRLFSPREGAVERQGVSMNGSIDADTIMNPGKILPAAD
jgi:hypothetical protein